MVREESVFGCGCERDSLLSVTITGNGDGRTDVRLLGELDLFTAVRVAGVLRKLLRSRHGVVAVDLSGLTFIGARGLAVFLDAAEDYGTTDDVRLVFTGLSDRVRRLFRLTGLAGTLTIE